MRAATIAIALATLVMAGCRDEKKAGKPLSDSELQRLVLQAGDLGKRYQEFASGRTLRVELSPALEGEIARFDRQDGWTARYRKVGTGTGKGPLTVVSTIDTFAAPSGAADFFDAVEKQDERTGADAGLAPVEIPRLGDESRGAASARTGSRRVRYVTILWREGRFVAAVSASGLGKSPSLEEILALARRQHRRLR